jgi:hypothetical protein
VQKMQYCFMHVFSTRYFQKMVERWVFHQ